jgi:hypothetical protein
MFSGFLKHLNREDLRLPRLLTEAEHVIAQEQLLARAQRHLEEVEQRQREQPRVGNQVRVRLPDPPVFRGLYPGRPIRFQDLNFNVVARDRAQEVDTEYDEMPVKRKTKERLYNLPLNMLKSYGTSYSGPFLGIEIECEGKKLFDAPLSYWAAKQDGSLHPKAGSNAIEYVFTKPLDRKMAEKALRYLEKKLQEVKASLDDSPRTSVHVHINVSDLTIRQIYCIILLWIIFEDILVEFCGPDRKGNLFCLSAKDSEYFPRMLTEALERGNYRDRFREDYRYLACNVAALFKFGSLEFRPMRGTVDVDTILNWVDMLLCIYTKALTYDSPPEFIHQFLQEGPIPFFNRIFDNQKLNKLLKDTPDLHSRLWSSMRIARDVAFVCRWEKPLPPELVKEEKPKEKKYFVDEVVRSNRTGRLHHLSQKRATDEIRSWEGPIPHEHWEQPAFMEAWYICHDDNCYELIGLTPVNEEEANA